MYTHVGVDEFGRQYGSWKEREELLAGRMVPEGFEVELQQWYV